MAPHLLLHAVHPPPLKSAQTEDVIEVGLLRYVHTLQSCRHRGQVQVEVGGLHQDLGQVILGQVRTEREYSIPWWWRASASVLTLFAWRASQCSPLLGLTSSSVGRTERRPEVRDLYLSRFIFSNKTLGNSSSGYQNTTKLRLCDPFYL